jgi:hypothetical protein
VKQAKNIGLREIQFLRGENKRLSHCLKTVEEKLL